MIENNRVPVTVVGQSIHVVKYLYRKCTIARAYVIYDMSCHVRLWYRVGQIYQI